MMKWMVAIVMAVSGMGVIPARAEQMMYYNFNNEPLGPYKPAYTYLPNISYVFMKRDIVDQPFKTRALRLVPEPYDPRLVEFTTTSFDARRWKQMLTIWSGSLSSTGGTIEFRLFRTPGDIYAAFTARNGKLYVKSGGVETAFGTYKSSTVVNGKTVPAIHSFIILNDLEKKTFKVTMLTPDGTLFTSKPLPMPITDPFAISPLTLQFRFANPLEPLIYTVDDVGLSTNFAK